MDALTLSKRDSRMLRHSPRIRILVLACAAFAVLVAITVHLLTATRERDEPEWRLVAKIPGYFSSMSFCRDERVVGVLDRRYVQVFSVMNGLMLRSLELREIE